MVIPRGGKWASFFWLLWKGCPALPFPWKQAIDSFGNRYLLGVFENKDDAKKAFDAWNKEYEQVPDGDTSREGWSCRMSMCFRSYCWLIYIVICILVCFKLYKYHPFEGVGLHSTHLFSIQIHIFSHDSTRQKSHLPMWSLINGDGPRAIPSIIFQHWCLSMFYGFLYILEFLYMCVAFHMSMRFENFRVEG